MHALSRGRLHFSGPGRAAVLFVHGGFHGAWCWSETTDFLASRGIATAAIDLRGHGGLSPDDSFLEDGVDAMTQDVIEAMRVAPVPFLAGHSLGALIAMKAAGLLPLRGLILLAPAPPAGISRAHPLPRFPAGRAVQPPDATRARKWFMSGATAPDMARYLAQLCPESPRLLNESFHEGVAIERASINCPILCLSGGKDDSPLHPAGQDQAIAAHYGATLKVVEASGHSMMIDDGREETASAIHIWIAGQ
ncbi:MAG: alpha/beta hydrolase [Rhodospirillaceae bacterium]